MATQHIGEILGERNIKLIGADPLTQRGFTQLPNAILKHPDLSPGAKLTYALLLSYAYANDFCFPGQDRLAKDMGVGRTSANTYIKELKQKGFINVTRQGLNRPNIYEVNLKAKVLKKRRA
jgi:DNA-binding MarR family transcriptional regulator